MSYSYISSSFGLELSWINAVSLSKVSKAHSWKVPVSFYGRFPPLDLVLFTTDIARSEHVHWIVTIVVYNHVLRIEESGLSFADLADDRSPKKMRRRVIMFTRYILPGANPTFSLSSTRNLRVISHLFFFYYYPLLFIMVIVIVNFTHYIVIHYRLLSLLLRLLL